MTKDNDKKGKVTRIERESKEGGEGGGSKLERQQEMEKKKIK